MKILIASIALSALCGTAQALDRTYLEFAAGEQVQMAGVGAQWDWDRRWHEADGAHVGGYWDLSLAHWRGTKYRDIAGEIQPLTSVGVTPVVRWQHDSGLGFYAEAGVGIYLLSDLYNNNNHQLSTAFQFGDRLGMGYVFDDKLNLGLRFQHFSNARIKEPNDGANFVVLRVSYAY